MFSYTVFYTEIPSHRIVYQHITSNTFVYITTCSLSVGIVSRVILSDTGVPSGSVGYPRAYENQLREFNFHRVQTLAGIFSCIKKNDQRKARERELATFDENRRAVGMMNPMRDNN